MYKINPENYSNVPQFEETVDDKTYSLIDYSGLPIQDVYSNSMDYTTANPVSYKDFSSTFYDQKDGYSAYHTEGEMRDIGNLAKQLQVMLKINPEVAQEMALRQIKGDTGLNSYNPKEFDGLEKTLLDNYDFPESDVDTSEEGIQYFTLHNDRLEFLTDKYAQKKVVQEYPYKVDMNVDVSLDMNKYCNPCEIEIEDKIDTEDNINFELLD